MSLEQFNEERELEAIKRRYDLIPRSISYTLVRLRESTEFADVVKRLRVDKWKDWHILLAIHNGFLNWHIKLNGADKDAEKANAFTEMLVKRLWEVGETAEDLPVSIEYFSYDSMNNWLNIGIMHYLQQKGAEFGSRGYDLNKTRKIAEQKFKYLALDIEHSPLFE